MPASKSVKIWSILLIVIVGLLNFHIPHFLIESKTVFNSAAYALEFALLLNVLGALISAFGIYYNKRWGWILGIIISLISFLLYIAQETIGLPGLPQMWLEKSRIAALIIEIIFVILAVRTIKANS